MKRASILLLLCCTFTLRSPKHTVQVRSPVAPNLQADALRTSLLAPLAKDPARKAQRIYVPLPPPWPIEVPPVALTGSISGGSSSTGPAPKSAKITWNFPVASETPDLVFKLRHSLHIAQPLNTWAVVTNLSRTNRSVTVLESYPWDFFTLTASNSYGENYATK